MNIFMTNSDPRKCADEHCLIHQVKMLTEYAQLLSTAHAHFGSWTDVMYKPTHTSHPSAIWVRESAANYRWLYDCWHELAWLFSERRGCDHGAASAPRMTALAWLPRGIPNTPGTPIVPAVKGMELLADPILTYQKYMLAKWAEWKSRERPLAVDFNRVPPKWAAEELL
jgi:hypothetical protein